MPCYSPSGVCPIHGNRHHYWATPHVGSLTLTTFATLSPNDRRSPHVAFSPPLLSSPLPPLAALNFPSPSCRNSLSPVASTLLLTTSLEVEPLVAQGTSLSFSKVHYDLSKDPHTARISTCGIGTHTISNEQRDHPVVQGALLNTNLHITFDHPIFTDTLERNLSLTVGDLLKLLYSHFHQRLAPRESSSLKLDLDLYPVAVENQRKRCQAEFDSDGEWRKGMKRIDVLGKESKFRGVELDSTFTHSHLTLHVALGR